MLSSSRNCPRPQQMFSRSPQRLWLVAAVLLVLAGVPGYAANPASTGALQGTTTGLSPQGQPFVVAGVTVKLTGNAPGLPSLSTYSDNTGVYEFSGLPVGSYTLEASLGGFKPVTKTITIAAGKTVVERIRMEFQEVRQKVEVRETAPVVSTQSTTPPTQTLQTQQLLTLPVVQREFKQVLPVTPGVLRMQSGKIFIKGVPEGQSMLLLDSAQTVDPVTGEFSIDVPVDAIQTLNVYKAPFSAQYGGFVGGMTDIELKPPPSEWHLVMRDLNPSLRGKAGHLVGFARATPLIRFGGPLWKDKINFAESFLYEMRKPDVRGLAWPNDEKKIQGYNSITNFQFILSPRHLMTMSVNLFPRRDQWADLNVLVPRPATADRGQRGYSIDGSDSYQFTSGGILHTLFKYTRIDAYAHGHGPEDMLVTPSGIGGNYFNTWARSSQQDEGRMTFNFPNKQWLGNHELSIGTDVIYRNFDGLSQSHPVLLLRNDGSAAERIDFTGAGNLAAAGTEASGFGQDHWILNSRLALTLGLRYFGQTNGQAVNFAPRLGLVYALDQSAKTVVRGGIGMFHDRTPMLGATFADNPEQILTPLDLTGSPSAPPVSFRNVCAKMDSSGPQVIPSCSNLGSTPYNLTWSLQLSRRISQHVTAQVSTLYSHTFKVFVIDPVLNPGNAMLMLANRGSSRYHEYEFTVGYDPSEKVNLSLSYVRSSSRGDLNTLDDIFVPFQIPVIRPNAYGNLLSDVPNRLTGFGSFKLPWSITLTPSVDLHSGFPYSNVDVLQNYVGAPNSQRYPIFFSLNWRIYKDFPLPFHIHPGHKFRLGIYSIDTTGRENPTAIYNNIASSQFGQFAGLGKRINGIVIEFAQ
ncbi:MAG TPA: TonB-dependent receptor [Terriglobia bacterium]|nr:TonB-dependent receptor [Terriglobia bacterium]